MVLPNIWSLTIAIWIITPFFRIVCYLLIHPGPLRVFYFSLLTTGSLYGTMRLQEVICIFSHFPTYRLLVYHSFQKMSTVFFVCRRFSFGFFVCLSPPWQNAHVDSMRANSSLASRQCRGEHHSSGCFVKQNIIADRR